MPSCPRSPGRSSSTTRPRRTSPRCASAWPWRPRVGRARALITPEEAATFAPPPRSAPGPPPRRARSASSRPTPSSRPWAPRRSAASSVRPRRRLHLPGPSRIPPPPHPRACAPHPRNQPRGPTNLPGPSPPDAPPSSAASPSTGGPAASKRTSGTAHPSEPTLNRAEDRKVSRSTSAATPPRWKPRPRTTKQPSNTGAFTRTSTSRGTTTRSRWTRSSP